jgi:RHS repeat-associated protein
MYFAHTNLLGTVRVKSDETGAVARTCDYGPYGDNESCSPADTYGSEVRYAGYERDKETGLDHMWFRYYNPRIGRFMSADPLSGSIGDPQSLNKVAYVTGNPTNATDPLGLFGCGGGNSDACPKKFRYTYSPFAFVGTVVSTLSNWYWKENGSIVTSACLGCANPAFTSTVSGAGGSWVYNGSVTTVTSFLASASEVSQAVNSAAKKIKKVVRKIGEYIPVNCGGGSFRYRGLHVSNGATAVSASQIDVADSRAGFSSGTLAEISGGQFLEIGYGTIVDTNHKSSADEHLAFLGLGFDVPAGHFNVSLFAAKGDTMSFGLVTEGGLLFGQGGSGVYTNIDNATSCVDHGGL